MSEGEQFTTEYIQGQLTDMNRYNPENQVIVSWTAAFFTALSL